MSDINIVLENRDDIHVAVEEKDINVEVPAGKDGRSLRPRGEWSVSAAYAYLDLVSYQGSSYVATKAVPAGTLPTDTSYWMLSAEKGEPGGAVWGNIAGNIADQTDLADALDAKADVIISSASGSIASFSDGSPAPVTALSVSIDPVQDLHGYDNPWPAGGGANKLDYEILLTWKQNNNNIFSLSGNNLSVLLNDSTSEASETQFLSLSAGTYTLSADNKARMQISWDRTKQVDTYNTKSISFTLSEDRNDIHIKFSADSYPYNLGKVQITAGTTIPSWTPYSNICPISGHDTATVTRTGKNMFDVSNAINATNAVSAVALDGTITFKDVGVLWSNSYIGSVLLKGGTSYRIAASGNFEYGRLGLSNSPTHAPATGYYVPCEESSNPEWSVGLIKYETQSRKFTPVNTGIYYIWWCSDANQSRHTAFSTKIQIELGSSVTSYEAPNIQTVTIDLDGTRYGGVLNLLTGELRVNRKYISFTGGWNIAGNGVLYIDNSATDGVASKNHFICNMYPFGTIAGGTATALEFPKTICLQSLNGIRFMIYDAIYTTAQQFNDFLANNPLQVVYPLSTPFTVTLTPSQLSTLLGENNIWADTGDVAVEYRADTKRYIDSKFSQLQALILEN